MNIVVVKSRDLDEASDEKWANLDIEEGFPFLVDTHSERVIEPVFRYLLWRFRRGQRFSPKTAHAYAEGLKEWFYHLAYYGDYETDGGWPWDAIDHAQIEDYLAEMADTISPKTGAPYKPGTIHQRATIVVNFYSWASDEGRLKTDLDLKWRSAVQPSPDTDPMRHTRSAGTRAVSGLIPPKGSYKPLVTPIQPDEYQSLLRALGQKPTDWTANSDHSCRDHLIAEWGMHTGMRIDEVLSLELAQILNLANVRGRDPCDRLFLPIHKTKGLKPRHIELPIWLLDETFAYIDGERTRALNSLKSLRDPKALFLHHPGAPNPSATGIRYRTVHTQFAMACERAGLTTERTFEDAITGSTRTITRARYSPHTQRHTFAAYQYLFAVAQGIREPWVRLQSLLGHSKKTTTINTYLRAVSLLDPNGLHGQIAEKFQETFRAP